ncbi:F5/8 type C domain-containing protein [Arachidicoccus rhizosphaerae]|jgi:hypothetical protein|uniref:F5/8 type C domain-containing protein n=1 Tax=Arachidicoccus rhizosphaerae TaxID=551991 RepID=A0A1H3VR75_9BACT|nr:DUF1735 domain-containing protein [Arachidicoccus rhizosphaerae]SDZ77315.1 F5/8 type C domain-containing protein [Arachidicoccus rhizosphaerae]
MKRLINKNSRPLIWLMLMTASIMAFSCNKWDDLTSPNESSVYMAQSGERGELHFYRIDSVQEFYFGASVGGFNGAPQNMNVSFEVDPSLVSTFNTDHSYLNYNFVELPDSSYTISGLESTIDKGVSDSKALKVSVMVNKLDPYTDYVLPIKIKSISAGNLDTTMSVSYFFIDSLYIRSRTVSGTLTVSNENSGGANAKEGSVRLNDNDYSTKFLYNYVDNSWMQLKLDAPAKLNAYELTSGNDADDRDPKNWQFLGSNDGSNWTVLDEHTDYKFYNRSQTIRFEYNDPSGEQYQYYRLLIQKNNGSNLFQMTEWTLLQYY